MTAARAGGTFMVVCAGGMAGFTLASSLDRELAELDRLEAALLTLSSEVSYALQPLPAALANAGERAGGATGALLARLGALTGLSQRRTPVEALEQALAETEDWDPRLDRGLIAAGGKGLGSGGVKMRWRISPQRLSPFELDLLRDLARNLGTSGHREQLRYIEMSIDRVRSRRADFAAECRKKAKLYRYLGIAAGASVAIVLM